MLLDMGVYGQKVEKVLKTALKQGKSLTNETKAKKHLAICHRMFSDLYKREEVCSNVTIFFAISQFDYRVIMYFPALKSLEELFKNS